MLAYLFAVDAGLAAMLFIPIFVMVWLYSVMMRGNADDLVRLTLSFAHADNSPFVEAGAIVESGLRKALVSRNGRFAGYWRKRHDAPDWRLDPATGVTPQESSHPPAPR